MPLHTTKQMSKNKKAPKSYWNHRIVTELIVYPQDYEYMPRQERIFSIVEMHYKNGKPQGYSYTHQINGGRLINIESLKSLKREYKQIKRAFKMPIIDGDNFPKKYKKKNVKVNNKK